MSFGQTKFIKFIQQNVSAIVLLLVLLVITVPQFAKSLHSANDLPFSWTASKFWIQSAECARTTGAILSLCKDGGLVPMADGFGGDDPGHALALDIYSLLSQKAVTPADISVLNSIFNYAGILILALLLFRLKLSFASFLLLAAGPLIADQFHATSPHPAQFGCACLVALFPLALLGLPATGSNRKTLVAWLALAVVGIAIAALFRQAIGLMGMVAGFMALAIHALARLRPRNNLTFKAAMAVALLISYQAPYLVLKARDAIFHLPPSTMLEQHGIWHNLYIGLGAAPNPFGIEWADANAKAAAERIDPSVVVSSPRYFDILREQYFEILAHHPIDVVVVYLRKLEITLKTGLPGRINVLEALLLLGFASAIYVSLSLRSKPGWTAVDAALIMSWIYIIFFIGQAMLFHYSIQYLFPIQIFFLLIIGVTAECIRSVIAFRIAGTSR